MKTERINDYEAAVSYILGIPRFSAKNDMETTKSFLTYIGENENAKVIHVAGTNGKGSVCAFLDSVHRKMGCKTGLFTSPHLVDIRERICIDGQMISREDFLDCTNYVLDKIEEFNGEEGTYHPSFFEFVFFIAVRYFALTNVDVEIFETGLGGRLDATNSLSRKDICIITPIGMDHMEYLGDSIGKIAGEKAGIIKSGVPVVYMAGEEDANQAIETVAKEKNAYCYQVNESKAQILGIKEKNIDFSYKCDYDSNAIFTVHTYALYQVSNASLCLSALQILYGEDIVMKEEVHLGISSMNWPGRMEEVVPGVFVDGGHNVHGVRAFIESVKADGYDGRRMLLFSAVSDKQVDVMGQMLVESGLFNEINVCRIDNSRGTETEILKQIISDSIKNSEQSEGKEQGLGQTHLKKLEMKEYSSLQEAYDDMVERRPQDYRMYICGSLYLVGAVKEYIEEKYD